MNACLLEVNVVGEGVSKLGTKVYFGHLPFSRLLGHADLRPGS